MLHTADCCVDQAIAGEPDDEPPPCLFCGEPEVAELHEVWGPREFMMDTCCFGMHEAINEFLAEDPKRAAQWLGGMGLNMLGFGKARRIVDVGGQLVIDWNLEVKPVAQSVAKHFVRMHHDHCPPPAGWRFGAGLMNGSERIGVVMVGRAVSRMLDPKKVVEVNRLCINRDLPSELVWNGCSKLYGWASKEARKRGFPRIITYTLESEDGTSLRAAGWVPEALTKGGSWNRRGRPRVDKTSTERKVRWAPAWCAQQSLGFVLVKPVAPGVGAVGAYGADAPNGPERLAA